MIDWSLLLDLLSHLVITGLISFILFKRYREIKLIFISFMTGVLVDLDHLFDYFFWKRIAAYNLKEFFNPGLYVKATQKVFCPLHGWEYLVILFFLRTIFNRRGKKQSLVFGGQSFSLIFSI